MSSDSQNNFFVIAKNAIIDRLSLTGDKADDTVIDDRIRNDIEMKGSNLWVLMFAIFVASIGLNVNSTAVIIGAMLISPLMGPIMGIGYGAGINDFTLIRKSFKNLAIATVIGLLTSTTYFLISPLSSAQSELLARTTPNVWDVLIALFGGLAGIVAATRKEKTNVIPGVAIATALMPPLCTAGFGLATGNFGYFFGAFYLYIINCVFIAISSFIIIRVFNIAEKKYIDPALALKAQRYIVVIAIATILPSSYLAYKLVNEEIFKAKAASFVNSEFNLKNTTVSQLKINPKTNTVKVFLVGEHVPTLEIDKIKSKMTNYGLAKADIKVYQNGEKEEINLLALKTDIITDLYKDSQANMKAAVVELSSLQDKIAKNREYFHNIPEELKTIMPKIDKAILSETYGADINSDKNTSGEAMVLNIISKNKMNDKELEQIKNWLNKRTGKEHIEIFVTDKALSEL